MERRQLLSALRGGVSGEQREEWEEKQKIIDALMAAGQAFKTVGKVANAAGAASGAAGGAEGATTQSMPQMSGKAAAQNPIEADKSPVNRATSMASNASGSNSAGGTDAISNLAKTVGGLSKQINMDAPRGFNSRVMMARQRRAMGENPALNPPGLGIAPRVPDKYSVARGSEARQQEQQDLYQRLMAHFLAGGGRLPRRGLIA